MFQELVDCGSFVVGADTVHPLADAVDCGESWRYAVAHTMNKRGVVGCMEPEQIWLHLRYCEKCFEFLSEYGSDWFVAHETQQPVGGADAQ